MKLLPWFLFLFQNWIITILQRLLQSTQAISDKFIWGVKRPRMRNSVLQLLIMRGVLTAPNLTLYYNVAMMENLTHRWNTWARLSWDLEQCGVEVPLFKGVFYEIDLVRIAHNCPIYKSMVAMWKAFRNKLAPGLSPLASLFWHPRFRVEAHCSISNRGKKGVDPIFTISHNGRMYYSIYHIKQKLGNMKCAFQYL